MSKERILKFLFDACQYIYKERESFIGEKEKNSSTTITFEDGDFKFNDNFFGGEPFGGREVVFYKDKPIWMMVYYGWVKKGEDIKKIYNVLIKAFRETTIEKPYRGPDRFVLGDFEYKNSVTGDLENLQGIETISKKGNVIFTTKYIGGWVDKK